MSLALYAELLLYECFQFCLNSVFRLQTKFQRRADTGPTNLQFLPRQKSGWNFQMKSIRPGIKPQELIFKPRSVQLVDKKEDAKFSLYFECQCIRVCQDLFLLHLNPAIMMVEINNIITLSHTVKYLHTDDLVHSHETESIRSVTVNYAWKSSYIKFFIY